MGMRPLWQVQEDLDRQYMEWKNELNRIGVKIPISAGDVFHFLYMNGYVDGKKFYKYVNSLPHLSIMEVIEGDHKYPLMEGYIPMMARVGKIKKKGKE